MRTLSVRSLVQLVAALSFLCPPLRSFGGDTTRSIGSLTPDQRMHLPDNTQVTVLKRTVTLGTLRAEHRARMERFSRAGLWGKRIAEKISKPGPASSQKAQGVPPGPSASSLDLAANQVTVGDGKPGRPPVTGHQKSGASNTTAAAQPQQQGASPLSKSGAGSAGNNPGRGTSALLTALIPRQTYNQPVPADYTAFCNAALASACIYLPPNTIFTPDINGNPNSYNRDVIDVDPFITDQTTCSSLGGTLDGQQQCEFKYFYGQQTTFKQGLTLTTAASCDQPSYYVLHPELGWIVVAYPPPSGFTITTGATPITCVLQAWD